MFTQINTNVLTNAREECGKLAETLPAPQANHARETEAALSRLIASLDSYLGSRGD